MDKYSFLHKSLITQSVACSNDGIILVYYMYIIDNFTISFPPYEQLSFYVKYWYIYH